MITRPFGGTGVEVAVPKASRAEHVRENATALDVQLSAAEIKAIEGAF